MQTVTETQTIAAQLRALADEFEAFEAQDGKPPKFGLSRTAKLAVSTLLKGVLLSPDQLGSLQALYDRLAAAELASQVKKEYIALINKLDAVAQSSAANTPRIDSGPNGMELDLLQRSGIPLSAINTVTLAARQYGRDLRGEIDPPIAPDPEFKPIVSRCLSCHHPFTVAPRRGSLCPRCGTFQL